MNQYILTLYSQPGLIKQFYYSVNTVFKYLKGFCFFGGETVLFIFHLSEVAKYE